MAQMTSKQMIKSAVMLLLPIILLVILGPQQSKTEQEPVQREEYRAPDFLQIDIGIIWTSEENAREHFEKHGKEFNASSVGEYVAEAQEFVRRPPQGTLTTTQLDGDTVYFHPETGRFAVQNSQGKIRTYFIREENLKGYKSNMEYFNEQAKRK